MSDDTEIPEEVKIFLVEGYENLDQVEQDLVSLETHPNDQELLNSVFRSIHTIKGNSGFLGLSKLEGLCHKAETLLDKMRNGEIVINGDITSALLETVDSTRKIFASLESSGAEGDTEVSELEVKLAGLC